MQQKRRKLKLNTKFIIAISFIMLLILANSTQIAAANSDTVIVDNGATGTKSTGSWRVSAGPKPYGRNSIYAKAGASYTWNAKLPQSGTYQVYIRWTPYRTRASSVAYKIDYNRGSKRVFVNQKKNAGQWNLVGSYYFLKSKGGTVTLSTPKSTSQSYNADAVKFVLASKTNKPQQTTPADNNDKTNTANTGKTIIVDNGNTGTSSEGTWKKSAGKNPYGESSLYGRNGASYNWDIDIPTTGRYKVFLRWTTYSSRSTKAPVNIQFDGGNEQVFVNQKTKGSQWNLLGEYNFNESSNGRVTLHAPSSKSYSADAVKLVYTGDSNKTIVNSTPDPSKKNTTPKSTTPSTPSKSVSAAGGASKDKIHWPTVISQAKQNRYVVSSAADFNSTSAIAQPGDIILIANGTYNWGGLKITSNGTKENPIIYTALNPGKVTFKSSSTLFKVYGNWNIIGGFTINDIKNHVFYVSGALNNRLTDNILNRPGNFNGGQGYLEILKQSHNTRFDHNTVLDTRGFIRVVINNDAIKNGASRNVRIDNNTFRRVHSKRVRGVDSAGAVMQVGQADFYKGSEVVKVGTIFEYNNIHDFYGGTQQIISNKSSYNIYRYNNFINSGGGIGLRHGNYNKVYGNHWKGGNFSVAVFVKGKYNEVVNNVINSPNARRGISERMWGARPGARTASPETRNNTIAHNTIIGAKITGISLGFDSGGSKNPIRNSRYFNNLIVGPKENPFAYNPSGCINCTIDNNLYYSTGGNTTSTAINYDRNAVVSNPNLSGFEPTKNSRAVINNARKITNINETNIDFFGNKRDGGAANDIGAVEY